jgi:hypothetical protein
MYNLASLTPNEGRVLHFLHAILLCDLCWLDFDVRVDVFFQVGQDRLLLCVVHDVWLNEQRPDALAPPQQPVQQVEDPHHDGNEVPQRALVVVDSSVHLVVLGFVDHGLRDLQGLVSHLLRVGEDCRAVIALVGEGRVFVR